MEDYRANSNKAKEEAAAKAKPKAAPPEKNITSVVKTPAKTRPKRPKGKIAQFFESFIREDSTTVKKYIHDEVVDPAIRKVVQDIASTALDMFLWGKDGSHSSKTTPAGRVAYDGYYKAQQSPPRLSRQLNAVYSFDDVILGTRQEADEVLNQMEALLDTYHMVSVADYYDLVGITGRHTDNKYGWTDLSAAYITKVSDGYIIKLPRTVVLD